MLDVTKASAAPSAAVCAPQPVYHEWRVLSVVTLTSIATIIGSGILALPVTLYATPVPLFIALFTVAMIAQIGVVFALTELLQRAQTRAATSSDLSPSSSPSISPSASTSGSYDAIPPSSASASFDAPSESAPPAVSLFLIARYYLRSPLLRALYYATTLLGFVAIIVSYGLAGPQAVWQLAAAGATTTLPPPPLSAAYWALMTLGVLFFVDQLLPVFSSFTVLKGMLFVGVIVIVALLPAAARVASLAELFADVGGWGAAAAPFLMSCVALGGLANTTPVTFNLLPPRATKRQMRNFRLAVALAVVVCYLLNVGWVLAVLQVVPREAPPGVESLTYAYNEGQISTVPLISVLHEGEAVRGSVLKSIEVIVELFIVVSTGVSFFVMSAGLKSFLDGAALYVSVSLPRLSAMTMRWVFYVLAFGSILGLVLGNPKGFISMLTRFTSFALNLQAGFLVFVMLYYSRTGSPQARAVEPAEAQEQSPGSEEDVGHTKEGDGAGTVEETGTIALEMSAFSAAAWISFGSIFFAGACLLAAIGPFFGIKLGASE